MTEAGPGGGWQDPAAKLEVSWGNLLLPHCRGLNQFSTPEQACPIVHQVPSKLWNSDDGEEAVMGSPALLPSASRVHLPLAGLVAVSHCTDPNPPNTPHCQGLCSHLTTDLPQQVCPSISASSHAAPSGDTLAFCPPGTMAIISLVHLEPGWALASAA